MMSNHFSRIGRSQWHNNNDGCTPKNSLSHCVFFFIEAPIYSPSLPLPSSVWWITLTWSLGKSIKKSWKAFLDITIVRVLELTFPKGRCLLWSSPARLAPSEAFFNIVGQNSLKGIHPSIHHPIHPVFCQNPIKPHIPIALQEESFNYSSADFLIILICF